MNIEIEPGRYVVAVSGGVDSMVLLYLLQGHSGLKLTVAHFDHGIRDDSREDRLLVQETAKAYGLPFVFQEGRLGEGTAEAEARKARYDFLHKVRSAAGADAIVTAHHKDDALETAIINLVRGTGRKGLASLKTTDILRRPLLHTTKAEVREYAEKHGLKWREDSTNSDPLYLRNHIRHNVTPRLDSSVQKTLHAVIKRQQEANRLIDDTLDGLLREHAPEGVLDRRWFIGLPHAVSVEVMAAWLCSHNIHSYDKNSLERLTHGAKIHKVGRRMDVAAGTTMIITRDGLALKAAER